MLVGAFVASLMATYGGRQRDLWARRAGRSSAELTIEVTACVRYCCGFSACRFRSSSWSRCSRA